MAYKKVYEVYKDGVPIVHGTVDECAKALGITVKHFRRIATDPDCTKYEIVDATILDKSPNDGYKKALAEWDAFAAAVRKKYGIPEYKATKGIK